MFERTVSSLFSVDSLLTLQLSSALHVLHKSYADTNDKGHFVMLVLKKKYTKMLEGCTWIYHWKHLTHVAVHGFTIENISLML